MSENPECLPAPSIGDVVYDVMVEMPNDLPRTRGLKLTTRPLQGDRWIDIVIPPRK